jgi:hypothetical protein
VTAVVRVLLGVAGLAAAAYGAWLLQDDSFGDLVGVMIWLLAGVLLHDVVLAPVTIVLVFGARPDNLTLLDRNYVAGWALVAGLTLLGTLAWAIAQTRRSGRGPGARG